MYNFFSKHLQKINEQESPIPLTRIAKIFKLIDEEKKKNKRKNELLDYIKTLLPFIGVPSEYAIFILELYLLNFRKDGDYSDLTKDNLVDPRKLKGKWTRNTLSDLYTKTQLPFRGSNLEGYWDEDNKGVPYYVVKSYGWYPIYIFKDNRWYEVIERYSSSTGRQMYNANPVEWSDEISSNVILATKDEMKALEQSATYEDIMKNKKKKLKELEQELQRKRMSRVNRHSSWWDEEQRETPGFIAKFKVNSVDENDDKMDVVVDIYDVLKKVGNKGVETPENYLKGELYGITPKKVEDAIEYKLREDLRAYIGPRYTYKEPLPDSSNIRFRFNHLKK